METDAKGQLGGLDTPRAVREKIAAESCHWMCSSCRKNNEEILRECEEAVKELEKDGSLPAGRKEEEVPKELKIGLKDDMDREVAAAARASGPSETEAELAASFVGTAEDSAITPPIVSSSIYAPARPAQTVPLPTGSSTAAQVHQPVAANGNLAQAPQRQGPGMSNDGVPIWIDRAIAGVIICLIAMLLKMLLAL